METGTWVQILDEAMFVSLTKGKDLFFLLQGKR